VSADAALVVDAAVVAVAVEVAVCAVTVVVVEEFAVAAGETLPLAVVAISLTGEVPCNSVASRTLESAGCGAP
jgi:hypothetical protein